MQNGTIEGLRVAAEWCESEMRALDRRDLAWPGLKRAAEHFRALEAKAAAAAEAAAEADAEAAVADAPAKPRGRSVKNGD